MFVWLPISSGESIGFSSEILYIRGMKRILLLTTSLLLIAFCSQAQQADETPVLYKARKTTAKTSPLFDTPQRFHFGMQMGTSVGTNFRNGALWSNYVAPQMSYQLSPRWNINVGTVIANNNFNALTRTQEGFAVTPAHQLQTFVYTQGQYLVNDRLRLSGTAFYEINQFNQPRMNPQATNFNAKGASMHADFKITDHFSVGAGVQISNGNSYLRNGLYNNSMFYPSPYRMNTLGAW